MPSSVPKIRLPLSLPLTSNCKVPKLDWKVRRFNMILLPKILIPQINRPGRNTVIQRELALEQARTGGSGTNDEAVRSAQLS